MFWHSSVIPDAGAYELLFSFLSPAEKKEFLKLVPSNEDMGNHCVAKFTPPTAEEIRNARVRSRWSYPKMPSPKPC